MQTARKTIASPSIMLLEDDLLLAMDMEEFLAGRGYEVIGPYGRVEDALEALETTEIDGAVVDLNLHGKLSFPVIDRLRCRNVPVIVCSGYAELPELKQKLAGLPLLPKPWNPRKLERLLEDVFEAVPR